MYDPECTACRLGQGESITEYDRNVLHDLMSAGVSDALLCQVAEYILDAR
jgi:hypothetical protein